MTSSREQQNKIKLIMSGTIIAVLLLTLTGRAASTNAQTTQVWCNVRDFRPNDINSFPGCGEGHRKGLVQSTLGADTTPVYAAGGWSRTTAGNFHHWYHNTPKSIRIPLKLTLTKVGDSYTYSSGSFFPIDNQGYGNFGNSHNYFFTMACVYNFFYAGGEVFQFTGDDDVWVFINRKLVVDLGGVHGPMSGSVNLDSLGLTAGNKYQLKLFFAERCCCGSNFKLQTTLKPAKDCAFTWSQWSSCDGSSQRRSPNILKREDSGGAPRPEPVETMQALPAFPVVSVVNELRGWKISVFEAGSGQRCGRWQSMLHGFDEGKLCSLCKMSAWTAWTACEDSSVPRRRERTVVSEPSDGAPACPHKKEQSGCALCEISQWTSWGPVVAVSKKRNRTRRVIVEPVNTSKTCPDLLEFQSAQDCEMGDWEAWSSCLGSGTTKRSRTKGIRTLPSNGGEPCPDVQDFAPCNYYEETCYSSCSYGFEKDFESKRVVRPVAMWPPSHPLAGRRNATRAGMPLQFPLSIFLQL